MKISNIILAACCFLPSCQTSRSVHKTYEQRDTASQVLIITDDTHQTLSNLAKMDGKLNLRWVKYDTERPADPVTGKHPVKEEGNAELQVQTEEGLQTSHANHSELSFKSEESEAVASDKESDFNIRSPAYRYLLLLFVILILIFIVRKHKL